LEPLDLSPYLMCQEFLGPLMQPSKGTIGGKPHHTLRIQGRLDWVIAGCESGPGARPSHPDWFRSLRDQCIDAGTSFFLKQMVLNGKMIKMPELDGENWKEFPDAQRLS
jgi:protein gp37